MHTSVKDVSVTQFLERAAINEEKRMSYIYKALYTFIHNEGIIGTAFIWFDKNLAKKHVVTLGPHEIAMQKWIERNITLSFSDLLQAVENNTSPLADYTISLFPTMYKNQINGVWLIWANRSLTLEDHNIHLIHNYFEAITTFANTNNPLIQNDTVDEELIEAFRHKNLSSILAILSLTKIISQSNIVYFGDIDHQSITITSHLGTKHEGFGFELPIGEGFGGKAAQIKNMLAVDDYKNSPYRFQKVSQIIDREGIRSGLVFPIKDEHFQSSGVLYFTRTELNSYSLLEKLTLQRIIQSIEPLNNTTHSKRSFFTTKKAIHPIANKKDELRTMTQNAKQIAELEDWASDLIKGEIIAVDTNGITYNLDKRSDLTLHQMTEAKLLGSHHNEYGKVYYRSTYQFNQTDWPDFIDDLCYSITLVIERQMKTHLESSSRQTNWVESVINQPLSDELYYLGLRLGFPLEEGEIWIIKWEDSTNKVTLNSQMQLMDITLKLLKRRIVFAHNFAIIFNKNNTQEVSPDTFRNKVLKILPTEIRIIHGVTYQSFAELKESMELALKILTQSFHHNDDKYVLEMSFSSLDRLLKKEYLREELNTFSLEFLHPVTEYDETHDTLFTKTLAYNIILQSPEEVAKHLFVHKNTVTYRVNRAKEILNIDTDLPKDRIALDLAIYIWLKLKDPSFLATIENEISI